MLSVSDRGHCLMGRSMTPTNSIPGFVLLVSMLEPTFADNNCSTGRFGSTCILSCNCERSLTCDEDGQCPNNEACKSPFFGPGCQYVDLLITHASANIPEYVHDRNHSTCNPNSTARSLHLTLSNPQHFTWIKIHVSHNLTLFHRNFTIKLDRQANTAARLYRAHGAAIIVKVSISAFLRTNITIEGPVVQFICTINVSGGRNVARNQRVSQSSNYSGDPLDKVRAENSVDGNNSQDYDSGTCSRTEFESPPNLPYWNINYDRGYVFHRIFIYNSNVNMSWLSGFTLTTYNKHDQLMYTYTDRSPQPLAVYTFVLHLVGAFRKMQIAADVSPMSSRVLLFCEMEVFGEFSCPSQTWGLECLLRCKCDRAVRCSGLTGSCLYTPVYYCPPNTHGDLCEKSCPENCQYNVCDARSGACRQCIPGYQGRFCDQVCVLGKFGPNCSLQCSENCADPCDHITGYCECVDKFVGDLCSDCNEGWFKENCTCRRTCLDQQCDKFTGDCLSCVDRWTGPKCEECIEGLSGENCSLTCPRICPDSCDITGQCVSCVGQRTGPKCEDCPPRYYGALCDLPCSAYCLNRSCDPVDGICYDCIDGYRGDYCGLEVESLLPSVWLLPLIIPFLVLMVCCTFVGGGSLDSDEE